MASTTFKLSIPLSTRTVLTVNELRIMDLEIRRLAPQFYDTYGQNINIQHIKYYKAIDDDDNDQRFYLNSDFMVRETNEPNALMRAGLYYSVRFYVPEDDKQYSCKGVIGRFWWYKRDLLLYKSSPSIKYEPSPNDISGQNEIIYDETVHLVDLSEIIKVVNVAQNKEGYFTVDEESAEEMNVEQFFWSKTQYKPENDEDEQLVPFDSAPNYKILEKIEEQQSMEIDSNE